MSEKGSWSSHRVCFEGEQDNLFVKVESGLEGTKEIEITGGSAEITVKLDKQGIARLAAALQRHLETDSRVVLHEGQALN